MDTHEIVMKQVQILFNELGIPPYRKKIDFEDLRSNSPGEIYWAILSSKRVGAYICSNNISKETLDDVLIDYYKTIYDWMKRKSLIDEKQFIKMIINTNWSWREISHEIKSLKREMNSQITNEYSIIFNKITPAPQVIKNYENSDKTNIRS